MPRGARYQAEFKDEAVRLYQTSGKGFREIAEGLAIAPETLRRWVVRIDIDAGRREGLTTEEREELRREAREPRPSRGARHPEKSRGLLREGRATEPVVIFRFIHAEKATHRTRTMCRMLGVSRSGYYARWHRPPSRRAIEDRRLTEQIRLVHESSRRTYGAPRILLELRADGFRVSRKRVARLMRAEGLCGAHLRRRRPRSRPVIHPATDLLRRDFSSSGPDRVWVADITYWPTQEGYLHLAAVMDLYSRRIVGWSMDHHLRADLVIDAIEMAKTRRRPAPGLIHHSDRGSQYTSWAFGRALRQSQILQSMGRTGTAHDNAAVESFFGTLKLELLHGRRYRTREEAKAAIFEHIEVFYNRQRRHSTIGGVSPAEHERRYAASLAAV